MMRQRLSIVPLTVLVVAVATHAANVTVKPIPEHVSVEVGEGIELQVQICTGGNAVSAIWFDVCHDPGLLCVEMPVALEGDLLTTDLATGTRKQDRIAFVGGANPIGFNTDCEYVTIARILFEFEPQVNCGTVAVWTQYTGEEASAFQGGGELPQSGLSFGRTEITIVPEPASGLCLLAPAAVLLGRRGRPDARPHT
jgi:hypothetical protein